MDIADHACCTSSSACNSTHVPLTCGVECALSFTPLYHDCNRTINAIYDVHASDVTYNGTATTFVEFDAKCSALNPTLFTPKVDALLARNCKVDLNAVRATGDVSTTTCNDHDDMQMTATYGSTCVQVKANGGCAFLKAMRAAGPDYFHESCAIIIFMRRNNGVEPLYNTKHL